MRPLDVEKVLTCGVVSGFNLTLPITGHVTLDRIGDACCTRVEVGGGPTYPLPVVKPGRWVAKAVDCRTGCVTYYTVEIPPTCEVLAPCVVRPTCEGPFCGYFGAPYARASTHGIAHLWENRLCDVGCA